MLKLLLITLKIGKIDTKNDRSLLTIKVSFYPLISELDGRIILIHLSSLCSMQQKQ